MRGRSNIRNQNQTVTQRYGESIGKRYVPLKEYQGKDHHGNLIGQEVWHDFRSNTTLPAGPGWETPPPDLPSGDQGRLPSSLPPSEVYRQHYQAIDWSQ